MIPKGVRYTAVNAEVVTLKDADKRRKTLTVHISTDAVDRDGDVVLPGGGDFRHYRDNPVVLWTHQHQVPAIAKSLWERVEGHGVLACPQFAQTDFAQEIFELYADEILRAWSVGFLPRLERGFTRDELAARPEWTKARNVVALWEMVEYSGCNVPINPDALRLSLSRGERVLRQETVKALALPDFTMARADPYATARAHVARVRRL